MKKALSMLLAGTMAMSLVACSSEVPALPTPGDTTAAAAAEDTKAEGGDTAAAAGDSEDYGDYSWNLAMTVSETTTNYKMVEYFGNLGKKRNQRQHQHRAVSGRPAGKHHRAG